MAINGGMRTVLYTLYEIGPRIGSGELLHNLHILGVHVQGTEQQLFT